MFSASRLIIALVCALHLVGCASQTQSAEILISDGCVVYITGFSQTQADELVRSWNIDPKCAVEVSSEVD